MSSAAASRRPNRTLVAPTCMPRQPTTKPVPADRDAPVAPVRSALVLVAMGLGLSAADAVALQASQLAETSRLLAFTVAQ